MTQTDDLRTRALSGPWRAVITDEDHFVIDEDELVDLEGDVTISVVRASGLPVRQDDEDDEPVEQLPIIRNSDDCAFEEGCFDSARSALFVWHQAQAMAAGLNAASNASTSPDDLPEPVESDTASGWRRYELPGGNVATYPDPDDPYRHVVERDGQPTAYSQTSSEVESLLLSLRAAPADADATAAHGYTAHGHRCCPQAPADLRPPLVARCGGAGLCTACRTDAAAIHDAARTAPDADATGRPAGPDNIAEWALAQVLHLLGRLDESAQDMDTDLIRAVIPVDLAERVVAEYASEVDADATVDQPQPDREDQADEPKCSECGEPDPLNTHILGCEATCEHGVPMTVECEPCKS